MAKKKVKKKNKLPTEVIDTLKELTDEEKQKDKEDDIRFALRTIGKNGSEIWENTQRIIKLNQRIDRLVDAIDGSKRVKGI
jgi:hypothetical protein